MKRKTLTATLLISIPMMLFGVKKAHAQQDSNIFSAAIQNEWASNFDQAAGMFRLVSPAYPIDGACVITVISVPSTREGRPNFPLLSVEREVLVRRERIDCSSATRDEFAAIARDPPLPTVLEFLKRVVGGPDSTSRFSEGTDTNKIAICISSLSGERARIVSVGQPIVDNEDMDQFSATIQCTDLPDGYRIVVRGQPWSGGSMVWMIAGPRIHPE